MSKTEFVVFCPQCNMKVAAKVIAEASDDPNNENELSEDIICNNYSYEYYNVCICVQCKQPFLIQETITVYGNEHEVSSDEVQLYPIVKKLPIESIPATIRSIYNEAVGTFTSSFYPSSVMNCRKCLDAMCDTLNVKKGDLKKNLKQLSDDGVIDQRLYLWADEIRGLGNEAVHEHSAIVKKRDAQDALEFTETILINVFSLKKRFDAFKNRRDISKTKP